MEKTASARNVVQWLSKYVLANGYCRGRRMIEIFDHVQLRFREFCYYLILFFQLFQILFFQLFFKLLEIRYY